MSFWDCEKCKEQYKRVIEGIGICEIGHRIYLLEKQADIHTKEHEIK